jgi:hypothetical protein
VGLFGGFVGVGPAVGAGPAHPGGLPPGGGGGGGGGGTGAAVIVIHQP